MASFKSEQHGQLHIIHCPEVINDAASDQIELLIKTSWLKNEAEVHVFDFKLVKELSRKSYRAMVHFKQQLKAFNKNIVTIGMSKPIYDQVLADGMKLVFNPARDIQEAIQNIEAAKPRPTINIEFLAPFVNAVKLTLDVQAKTPVEVGKPQIKKTSTLTEFCVVSVLSLDADTFQGSVVLCFPKAVFLGIYKNMFGEDHQEVTQEIQDAAGEILNIVFGIAKRELVDKKGFKIRKALPTVLSGENLSVQKTSHSRVAIILPCKTSFGEFTLEIHLGPNG